LKKQNNASKLQPEIPSIYPFPENESRFEFEKSTFLMNFKAGNLWVNKHRNSELI
jgi:hypothetical protein